LIGYLGAALTASAVSPLTIALDDETTRVRLSATGFRQRGLQLLMLRVNALEPGQAAESNVALEAIEQMPDAFVLTDAQKAIVSANVAFVEMVEAASLDQIRGRSLGEFVGRPGIDLELIDGQVSKHGFARNVATIVGGRGDQPGEPVELSAVVTGGATPHYAFVLRHVGRRLSSMPRVEHDLPRSVEHLTELVGRMSLKDIVRESTDLIERLCIEAALSYTADNRASAAEILGLSRQSLYSKLHRYGLGNLVPETD
jgi:transcriptional regulator PpsR